LRSISDNELADVGDKDVDYYRCDLKFIALRTANGWVRASGELLEPIIIDLWAEEKKGCAFSFHDQTA